ncbi:helix-turn-helix transcriptional regulator [Ensifer sp. IC3342]|nr:helix-turn-helix transcriptional regulator [Ensifer sp. BRP08]MCA1446990.1 helix-turn-helix transcriptional regulator [Ensifer sp. IC3342]
MVMRAKTRSISLFFKEWRIHAGFSQEELAERLGVTASTVSRIETGNRDFVGSYLFAFAKACNCPSPGDPVSRPPSQISIDALFRGNDEDRRRAEAIITAALRQSLWNPQNGDGEKS